MGNLTDCRHSVRFISIMYIALCLLLVVGALAQVPTTCPGPKSFEGRFSRFDRDRKERVQGKMAYDEDLKRIREVEEGDIAGKNAGYDRLILHGAYPPVMYEVDLSTKKCNITVPHHHWRPIGVPPDAKYMWEGSIGAAGVVGEHVTLATFGAKFDDGEFVVTVTYPDCYPVSRSFISKNDTDMTSYYDLKSGIADPDVFFPPKECTL